MNEIQRPFIKSLTLVAIVTIVSMGAVRYFVPGMINSYIKSSNYTLHQSQDHPESRD